MVSLAASNVSKSLTIFTLSLAASALLLAMKCLTLRQAFDAIKGRVILAIVATYGLGSALESTGVAALLAKGIVSIGRSTGDIGLLSLIFFTVALLSCVVSNAVSDLSHQITTTAHDFVPNSDF